MQAVAADFMDQGHFAAHLRLMRQLYRSRRDALLQALHSHVPWADPHGQPGRPADGRAPDLKGSEQACKRAKQQALGIATPSLSELYHARRLAVAGWRLGFAALTARGAIESAVSALR